jgi:hypothetical protein
VLCLRGIYGSTNKINFGKFYGELPEDCKSMELIQLRNTNPIGFLEKYVFKSYEQSYQAVGFKYFYDHNRHLHNKNDLVEYFLKNERIKFIHLKRDNFLEILFSYKRALAQNQWINTDTEFRTEISRTECESFFRDISQKRNLYDNLFEGRIIHVDYDKLTQNADEVLYDLQKFIGLNQAILSTDTKKSRELNLRDCITNYSELESAFKYSAYSAFF